MKMRTERTARSRELRWSVHNKPSLCLALQLQACEVPRPMICDNETLSVVDCNAISQNYWIYHGASKGSQDPVEFWGTVHMISGELLLISAEPSTNFSEWITAFLKSRHIYPIPILEKLQSILARKVLKGFSNMSCLLFWWLFPVNAAQGGTQVCRFWQLCAVPV